MGVRTLTFLTLSLAAGTTIATDQIMERVLAQAEAAPTIAGIRVANEGITINQLDKPTLRKLRKAVTNKTIRELSDLVLKHPAGASEGGGKMYHDNSRLRFYYSANNNDEQIEAIDTLDPLGPAIVPYLEGVLDDYSSDGECNASAADSYWEERIKTARQSVTDAERDSLKIKAAIDTVKGVLRDRYRGGVTYGDLKGRYTGDVHTHSNSTTFSQIDLCQSHGAPKFLVSHSYPTSDKFRLYVAVDGNFKKIGTYTVKKSK